MSSKYDYMVALNEIFDTPQERCVEDELQEQRDMEFINGIVRKNMEG